MFAEKKIISYGDDGTLFSYKYKGSWLMVKPIDVVHFCQTLRHGSDGLLVC